MITFNGVPVIYEPNLGNDSEEFIFLPLTRTCLTHPFVRWLLPELSRSLLMTLPTDSVERKKLPLARGVLDYFPDALAEVARVSVVGNEQHNPGEELHWARDKSVDHADCIMRHLIERGTWDTDGVPHTAKLAWRALALLQEEYEQTTKFLDKALAPARAYIRQWEKDQVTGEHDGR